MKMRKKGFLEIRNNGLIMNTFMDSIKRMTNYTDTENGALAHKSTLNKVYDMFALGGAYRARTDEDCILLFKNAYEESPTLALKCLFYLRDIRGGQGERRFFRVCLHWLANNYPTAAARNIENIAEYGRYDDLYALEGTLVEKDMFKFMYNQVQKDLESMRNSEKTGISLLGKWLKSENAASKETKRLGNKTREAFGLTHKSYRELLTALRKRINIVEALMSANRWDEIEFDKIPSRAGIIYRNAFAEKDITAARYKAFIESKETKMHTAALYPYDLVREVTKNYKYDWGTGKYNLNLTDTDRKALDKAWSQLKDYMGGSEEKLMGVIDTSGSMDNGASTKPIDVAISLGMYAAERLSGPFKNNFITFSSRPQLVEIEGIDFADKVKRIRDKSIVENTNLEAVFELLYGIATTPGVNVDDLPTKLVVISDMEIDAGSYWRSSFVRQTEMERIRNKWKVAGLRLPDLVYWNVCARNNIILDNPDEEGVSFVSGCSPVIFESILAGKSGWDLCYDKLMSERYEQVK